MGALYALRVYCTEALATKLEDVVFDVDCSLIRLDAIAITQLGSRADWLGMQVHRSMRPGDNISNNCSNKNNNNNKHSTLNTALLDASGQCFHSDLPRVRQRYL